MRNEKPLCAFSAVHPAYMFVAIKWRPADGGVSRKLKATKYVGSPPAQSVSGDARFSGITWPPARASAGQFRSPGGGLSAFAGVLRRSGRLRAGVRARPALPGVELQLSDRCHRRSRVLAEEHGAGAHPG